jgi:DNA replication protein DnaC
LLNKYLAPDLLIIDYGLPPKSGEILMDRYENTSTMITSNRPIEEWGTLLSDVPAASCSRLMHAGAVPARFVVHKSAMRQDVSTA